MLRKPGNRKLAIELTYDQFRFAFANAVDEAEARSLYDAHSVAGAGAPLFQAAFANLNPWTEASVDMKRADRGPLLILSGGKDNTVPWSIANASFKRYKLLAASTRIVEIPGRGHSLTIDSGWPASPTPRSTSSTATSRRADRARASGWWQPVQRAR